MNWKNRLTNYNFWISIVSAVLLIFQAFNLKFDIVYINEIATAVLGLLVVIGIISDPTKTTVKQDSDTKSVKVEETVQETTNEAEEKPVEETVIPIETENENGSDISQDDFKAIIEKISADLHNLTLQKAEEKVVEKVEEQPKIEEIKEVVQEELKPAEIINYNIVN